MSDIANGLIFVEKPQQCDDCGKIAELRPYGPNGSCLCYPCAMKDPIGTRTRMLIKMGCSEDEARKQAETMTKVKDL